MSRTTNDRQWVVDADPFAVEDEDLMHAIAEAAVVLRRVGGAILIVADRVQVAPEMYETERLIFKWSSYAPAKRQPEAVEEPAAA
jgi:hypothetical protein